LRAAGLVEVRGNARSYRYALPEAAAGAAGALLAELLSAPPPSPSVSRGS